MKLDPRANSVPRHSPNRSLEVDLRRTHLLEDHPTTNFGIRSLGRPKLKGTMLAEKVRYKEHKLSYRTSGTITYPSAAS